MSDEAGNVLSEISEYIGETTNNVAEYTALIRGLQEALRLGAVRARVLTDSELLHCQIGGRYKVKAQHLRALHDTALALMGVFQEISVSHVPREENSHADDLASRAARAARPKRKVSRPGAASDQRSLDI